MSEISCECARVLCMTDAAVCHVDTMTYVSSALSFMLENLAKPVIFTGAAVPFAEVFSDARRNLIVSITFAAASTFAEVS